MRGPYQIVIPLFSLFLVRVDLTDLVPWGFEARIIKVLDGDTVVIQHGHFKQSLRLSKVDAPEKKQLFLGSKTSAGEFSQRCLKRLIKENSLQHVVVEGLDIYGRLLGDIEGLSFKLIANGCTGLYPYAVFSSQKRKHEYLRALLQARRARLGLWKHRGVMQPKLWRKFSRRNADLP